MSVKLRKRKRSNNIYSLYLDIYHNGQRKTEYLGLYLTEDKISNKSTQQLAENIRAKRQLELQNQSYGFTSETRRKENFVIYFERLVKQRPADRSSWACTLKILKTFTVGSIAFQNITPEWLDDLKKQLLEQVSQITAYHYYSNIKFALNKAVKEKIIHSNPCQLVENIKKPETKREYLVFDEVQKLMNTKCGNEEVKDAFIFSCFTGLRFSDVKNLVWKNIKDNKIQFTQKKTSFIQYLPLSKTAQSIIDKRKDKHIQIEENIIFNLPTKVVCWEHIKNWVKAAKIEKRVSFHTARHTFATLSLTYGTDLYTVSKLLGHKDISTTQIYAKIIDKKLEEAVNNLPQINI
jgi:site-specific recombinase XerD